jgi:hypothetical protein
MGEKMTDKCEYLIYYGMECDSDDNGLRTRQYPLCSMRDAFFFNKQDKPCVYPQRYCRNKEFLESEKRVYDLFIYEKTHKKWGK